MANLVAGIGQELDQIIGVLAASRGRVVDEHNSHDTGHGTWRANPDRCGS
jgi:hypothetical protein